jgi:hypothetical protein
VVIVYAVERKLIPTKEVAIDQTEGQKPLKYLEQEGGQKMLSKMMEKSTLKKLKTGLVPQITVVILLALALIVVSFPSTPQAVTYPDAYWRGEYYNNKEFSGAPALVRDDGVIDFYWGFGPPGDDLIATDNFSVRWTRSVNFEGGSYEFYTATDDGVRLWVDDQLLIDQWHDQATETYEASMNLIQGWHHVKVEYFEGGGVAEARVWWDRTVQLNPANWRGEYYSNTGLAGSPSFVRDDGNFINFDWGFGSPGGGLGPEGFSVRWTRGVAFQAGEYQFYVSTDDGVRLWVDDHLIVDEWYDQVASTHKASINLGEGWHQLKMEYYENGGIAKVKLWWERTEYRLRAQLQVQELPEQYPSLHWRGEYYGNTGLSGPPAFVRDDGPAIDFDWEFGGPGGGLGNNNFSTRWTRSMSFVGGRYRFSVTSDDGVRLWVDDQRLIDQWRIQAARTYTADVTLVAGSHHLKVEYYEGGGIAEMSLSWELIEVAPPEECSITPTLGFGKVWTGNPTVRDALGCPTEIEKGIWSAEETFQNGYMFWREDLRHIYVLYDNSTWQVFIDTWEEGDAEHDPNIVAPAGLYQPKLGFGKVWREQPGVRDSLGWATMEERGLWGSIEPFEEGLMIWSDVEGIFVLYNNGTWEHYL